MAEIKESRREIDGQRDYEIFQFVEESERSYDAQTRRNEMVADLRKYLFNDEEEEAEKYDAKEVCDAEKTEFLGPETIFVNTKGTFLVIRYGKEKEEEEEEEEEEEAEKFYEKEAGDAKKEEFSEKRVSFETREDLLSHFDKLEEELCNMGFLGFVDTKGDKTGTETKRESEDLVQESDDSDIECENLKQMRVWGDNLGIELSHLLVEFMGLISDDIGGNILAV